MVLLGCMRNMISSDYPLTTAYGWVDGYPLNLDPVNHPRQGFHKGEDYYMPEGTPIVVNGVQIGVSGATGNVTGPHVHVGRWVGGSATAPNGAGWNLDNPHVTDVGYDEANGNYVGLLDGQGARWVYLHMREKSAAVKGNDVLANLPKYNEGGNMPSLVTRDDLESMSGAYFGSMPTKADVDNWIGKDLEVMRQQFEVDQRRVNYFQTVQRAFGLLNGGGVLDKQTISELWIGFTGVEANDANYAAWLGRPSNDLIHYHAAGSDERKTFLKRLRAVESGSTTRETVLVYVNSNLK